MGNKAHIAQGKTLNTCAMAPGLSGTCSTDGTEMLGLDFLPRIILRTPLFDQWWTWYMHLSGEFLFLLGLMESWDISHHCQ